MRKTFLMLTGSVFTLSAFSASVFAQDLPAAGDDDVLNELELLSRSADDPFAGVLDQEKREPVSVTLRALDKITARYIDIEVKMNEIARFGPLELQPRTCDKRPPEEFPETTVFLEVFDREHGERANHLKIELTERKVRDVVAQASDDYDVVAAPPPAFGEDAASVEPAPVVREAERPPAELYRKPASIVESGPQAEGVNIFRGWMFASSPALNSLEHPVYDVWVVDCKTRVVSN